MSISIFCRHTVFSGIYRTTRHFPHFPLFCHQVRSLISIGYSSCSQRLYTTPKLRTFAKSGTSLIRATTSQKDVLEMNALNRNGSEKLIALRVEMEKAQVAALIVPASDPHLLESAPERFRRREYISEFSGSAGIAVITQNQAALWTDGRYFLQATQQLSSDWILMKQGTEDCPKMSEWLVSVLEKGSKVGIDAFCHPESEVQKLKDDFTEKDISVVSTKDNLIDAIWGDQIPKQSTNPVVIHPLTFAGESTGSKLQRIRDDMKKKEASLLLVCKLEEIAWTLNLRGADDPHSPIIISYLLISLDAAELFINRAKISNEVETYLKEAGVKISDYSDMLTGVKEAIVSGDQSAKIWLDPGLVSHAIFTAVRDIIQPKPEKECIVSEGTPLTLFMATKNENELNGMREAHIRDAVALIEFLSWLEEQIESGKTITEVQIDKELTLRRSERPGFKGLSFPTIAGANEHGAIIHYSANEESCNKVDTNTLLLIDSGGQYDCGTTDITRTFHLGTPSDYQKLCFTKVLQGHIALATAKFPVNTPGAVVDAFARSPLWSLGLDYKHGTGHGVGAHLCVHEGPISISFRYNSPMAMHPLKENMIVSNEPGYYEDGKFGIRIENLCIIKKLDTKYQFGDLSFLGFETISLVPIQARMIDRKELTKKEIQWVDDYHQEIWKKLNEKVSSKAKEWLRKNTMALE